MAITALTICTQAWVDLGVGSPGDIMPNNEAVNALAKLNMWLDAASAARDLVFEILIQTFALTANQQAYPIGSSATAPFNVTRPVKIENAKIRVGGLDNEVDIISQKDWLDIIDKGATGTAPAKMYYDPQVPNAIINLHPIPLVSVATTLVIGTWSYVQQFALLTTSTTLPPAYLRLINLALQLELVPTYGRLVSTAIVQERTSQFADALATVRELNSLLEIQPLMPVSTPAPQQVAAQQASQG